MKQEVVKQEVAVSEAADPTVSVTLVNEVQEVTAARLAAAQEETRQVVREESVQKAAANEAETASAFAQAEAGRSMEKLQVGLKKKIPCSRRAAKSILFLKEYIHSRTQQTHTSLHHSSSSIAYVNIVTPQ